MDRAKFEAKTREEQIWTTWDYRRRPLYRGVAFMCPVLLDEKKKPLLIDGEQWIRIEMDDDLVVRFRRRVDGRHKGDIIEEIELERDFKLTPAPRADGNEPIEQQRFDTNPIFPHGNWLKEALQRKRNREDEARRRLAEQEAAEAEARAFRNVETSE